MLEDRIIFKEITVISGATRNDIKAFSKSSQTGGGYQEKMHNSWMNVSNDRVHQHRSTRNLGLDDARLIGKRTSSPNLIKSLRSTIMLHLISKCDLTCVFPTLCFLQKSGSKCELRAGDREHGPSEPTELNPKKNH